MFKILGVLAAGCALLVTAAPARADLTPDGPARILPGGVFPCPMVVGGSVVMSWQVTVGEGGRAGNVRPVFDLRGTAVVGDPVELPAAPGTYTFPAPRRDFDICADPVGIIQETGGHAIVDRHACRPDQAYDPCRDRWTDVLREGQPAERLQAASLALTTVSEPDMDHDLLGDTTEDRTDLRVSASYAAVTVTNAGPLQADRPVLTSDAGTCAETQPCRLEPLAVGASRTIAVHGATRVRVAAEGQDLAPADNEASVPVLVWTPQCLCTPPRPVVKPTVTTARRQTLRRGVKVALRGQGSTRVIAAFKVRGRTVRIARTVALRRGVERTVTLRAHGATLRTLRRAAQRGALRATITVSNAGGTATATARVS